MATLHSESSKELMRSSHDGRPLLFLIRGKGLRSRWQSRQSDCAERRRRSSEFKGALHSSQRGGPTRPLWSCAIEIPPSRTQTGEQMKQQSCVVKQASFTLIYLRFVWTHFGNLIILRWSEGPQGPSALHPMGAYSRRSSESRHKSNAQNEVPAADAYGAPALGRLQAVDLSRRRSRLCKANFRSA